MKHDDITPPGEILRSTNRLASFTLHILLPLIALACGIALTVYLLKTSPQAKPHKRTPSATLVEVQQLRLGSQKTVISAMGEVIPAKEIDMKPRVAGEVTTLSDEFIPGGFFLAGQPMLSIDKADYELVVRQLKSEAAKAESDLALEMGYQRIAQKEYELLGEQVSADEKDLILRQPQLAKLQASLDVARAKLAKAQLDLERTDLTAPFNTVIQSRSIDKGARVTESTLLARLVGTDEFWIRLTLPVAQLRWVRIPTSSTESGSSVKIYTQGGAAQAPYRLGQVIRLVAALEEQGRMAQLLVRVDDPLCRKTANIGKPRLLLGSYVRAEIEGIGIESAISIDRAHLHDGNTVWLMGDDGALDIREIEVLFRSRDHVVIANGVMDGERVVISSLSSPIEGIPLRLQQDDNSKADDRTVNKTAPGKGQGRRNSAE